MSFDFMKNKREATHLYIMRSDKLNEFKVGITKQRINMRVRQLNNKQYGGVSDWKAVKHIFQGAGVAYRTEIALGKILEQHGSRAGRQRGGDYERYSCDLYIINSALDAVGVEVLDDCLATVRGKAESRPQMAPPAIDPMEILRKRWGLKSIHDTASA